MQQHGPWADKPLQVTLSWLLDEMTKVITSIDWTAAQNDVQRFLPTAEQEGLHTWGIDLFMQQLGRTCNKI